MKKIGVFDSGVGAVSVIKEIRKSIPQVEVIYKDDKKHLPYGDKTIEQIHSFVRPIFQELISDGCRVIVIACNTVTTNLIDKLRQEFDIPMIGMEPAVKPAALSSKSKIIAVCATPRTLSSERYAWLKREYAKDIDVLEPDCSDWAMMIENNAIDREKIKQIIEEVIAAGVDQIVLGCTHYHWIEDLIKDIADSRAEVIQPTQPVINQLRKVLGEL